MTPRATPLQSPSTETTPSTSTIEEDKETVTVESEQVTETETETRKIDAEGNETIVTESIKKVTKDSNGDIKQTDVTTVTTTEISNDGIQKTTVETFTNNGTQSNNKSAMPDVLSEEIDNMKIFEKAKAEILKMEENLKIDEQLENADMTSMFTNLFYFS